MTAMEIPDMPAVLDRRAPKPLVFSYSLLNNYANVCPHQTYRKYIKKDLPFVESAAMKFGNDAHSALEYRLGGKPLPPNMQQWEPIMAAFDGRNAKAEQKLGIRIDCKPCGWFDDSVWLRTKIDVTLIQDVTAVIADHKTGRSDYEDPFELAINALVLHAHHPYLKQIKGFYIWLKESRVGQAYDLSDTNDTYNKVFALVKQFNSDKAASTWEKRKSGLCGYCSVGDCENHYVARPK